MDKPIHWDYLLPCFSGYLVFAWGLQNMQLICGMHRSGTSLVARIAFMANADLGDPQDFHPADNWNPDGYFEQKEIIKINSSIINGHWGRAAYFFLPSEQTIAKRAAKYQSVMESISKQFNQKVVKENRFCLTLQAWKNAGLQVDRILVIFRDPLLVAKSLKNRNKIPQRLAFSLWFEHYARLLKSICDIPTRFLWYDRLICCEARMEYEMEKMGWLTGCESHMLFQSARALVRFQHVDQRINVSDYPENVIQMYQNLIKLSGNYDG